jgi:hypothetical protein
MYRPVDSHSSERDSKQKRTSEIGSRSDSRREKEQLGTVPESRRRDNLPLSNEDIVSSPYYIAGRGVYRNYGTYNNRVPSNRYGSFEDAASMRERSQQHESFDRSLLQARNDAATLNTQRWPHSPQRVDEFPSYLSSGTLDEDDIRINNNRTRRSISKAMTKPRGRCVEGHRWVATHGGFVCRGGKFKMTEDLVAEGKGRFYYVREGTARNPIWDGPISPSEYYGNSPHMPLVGRGKLKKHRW